MIGEQSHFVVVIYLISIKDATSLEDPIFLKYFVGWYLYQLVHLYCRVIAASNWCSQKDMLLQGCQVWLAALGQVVQAVVVTLAYQDVRASNLIPINVTFLLLLFGENSLMTWEVTIRTRLCVHLRLDHAG